jgi:gluconate 2-dehydrogenase gamma chain
LRRVHVGATVARHHPGPDMERRDLLRALGAATALTAVVPHEALAAWARVASGIRPIAGLTEAQLALVSAVADTILPRTDTVGALDVGVPAFVDVVVTENYRDEDRTAFLAGLDAIDAQAKATAGSAFAELAASARGSTIEALEALSDRRAEPARTYWRLKGLVIHGYFTSEPVMKNVLKVQVMPGKFDGAAPMRPMTPRPQGGEAHA